MQDTVAVALIAVGGTVLTAVVGYAGTRHTTGKQLETAREATRAQLAAVKKDVKAIEAREAEEMRNARQQLYEAFLNAVFSFRDYLIGNVSAEEDDAGFSKAGYALRERRVTMEILGSDAVRPRAQDIFTFLIEIQEGAYPEISSARTLDECLLDRFTSSETKWKYLRDSVINAMRRETKHRQ